MKKYSIFTHLSLTLVSSDCKPISSCLRLMSLRWVLTSTFLIIGCLISGCDSPMTLSEESRILSSSDENFLSIHEQDLVKPEEGKTDSSLHGIFLDFEFDGKVRLNSRYWPERSIEQQLLYTIGQLNGDRSVGRLDQLELSDIQVQPLEAVSYTHLPSPRDRG